MPICREEAIGFVGLGTTRGSKAIQEGRLRCVECGETTHDGVGWRAYLSVGEEDAEEVEEVATYCPKCAAREFSGSSGRRSAPPGGLT